MQSNKLNTKIQKAAEVKILTFWNVRTASDVRKYKQHVLERCFSSNRFRNIAEMSWFKKVLHHRIKLQTGCLIFFLKFQVWRSINQTNIALYCWFLGQTEIHVYVLFCKLVAPPGKNIWLLSRIRGMLESYVVLSYLWSVSCKRPVIKKIALVTLKNEGWT